MYFTLVGNEIVCTKLVERKQDIRSLSGGITEYSWPIGGTVHQQQPINSVFGAFAVSIAMRLGLVHEIRKWIIYNKRKWSKGNEHQPKMKPKTFTNNSLQRRKGIFSHTERNRAISEADVGGRREMGHKLQCQAESIMVLSPSKSPKWCRYQNWRP